MLNASLNYSLDESTVFGASFSERTFEFCEQTAPQKKTSLVDVVQSRPHIQVLIFCGRAVPDAITIDQVGSLSVLQHQF